MDDGGFAGVVLLKKGLFYYIILSGLLIAYNLSVLNPTDPVQPSGSWDSIHVFETSERGRQAHYKLTSTIMLSIAANKDTTGEVNISGSMTRQVGSPYADSFITHTCMSCIA